jgi:hypothetical protein
MKKFLAAGLIALACLFPVASFAAPVSAPMQPDDTASIDISTATTTEIIPAATGQSIFVGGGLIWAGGTGNVTWKAGTGTNCGTNTRTLSGAINMTAQTAFLVGSGLGVSLKTRGGEALCITTSAAVQVSGWLAYSQR